MGASGLSQVKTPSWLLPVASGLALLSYGLTIRSGLGFGDSGELVAAAIELGVPHPPGYPVWTFLSHLWALLPGAPANNIALSSAVYMSLAVGAYAWLLWQLVASTKLGPRTRELMVFGCTMLFAWSPRVWGTAIETEVYALHVLLTLTAWVAVTRWARSLHGLPYVCIAALLLGLGLANHQTLLLAVPGYLAFALAVDVRRVVKPTTLMCAILPLLLGLSAYLCLPIWSARNPIVDWSNTEYLDGWLTHLTRRQYRSLELDRDLGTVFAQFRFFGAWLTTEYLGVVVVGVLPALVEVIRSLRQTRALLIGHAVAFAGSGIFFTYIANTELDNSNRAILSVYFILPGLSALLIAFAGGVHWLDRTPERRSGAVAIGALCMALAAAQFFRVVVPVNRHGNELGERYVHLLIAELPDDAVIVSGTGVSYFGGLYARVTGARQDITSVSYNRLSDPYYPEEIANQAPPFTWPEEDEYVKAYAQVRGGAGGIYGAERIALVNARLLNAILRDNPDVAFYYDEGIPVSRIYANAIPSGMLLRLSAVPVRNIDEQLIAADRAYWDRLAERLPTARGWTTDQQARQAYSRRRSTIGGWYAWHKRFDEAAYALEQALVLSMANVDAVSKLAMVYAAEGDIARGQTLLEQAVQRDPGNRTLRALSAAYERGQARWYGEQE